METTHLRMQALGPPRTDDGRRGEPHAPLGLDDALSRLTHCDWHPAALVRRLPELLRQAPTLAPSTRPAWLEGLERAWVLHREALDVDAKKLLLELAACWSYWPLVVAVGDSFDAADRLDDRVFHCLCDAYCMIGDTEPAIDLAVAMQLAFPARQSYAAAYERVAAWRKWRAGRLPTDSCASTNGAVSLEPLSHRHASDFRWQYHDPAIAQLCCLPRFEDDRGWHAWLDEAYAHAEQHLFAVMHRRWGFIGSVGLVLHGDVGLVYYWLGHDYRGRGYGPDAAAQLLAAAHRHAGMRCCYAKVFDYNAPSRRALQKIGFVATGIRAAAPHRDELFYRIGHDDDSARIKQELHALMAYLGSEVNVAPSLIVDGYGDATAHRSRRTVSPSFLNG